MTSAFLRFATWRHLALAVFAWLLMTEVAAAEGYKHDDYGGRSFEEIRKSDVLRIATRHRDGISIKDPKGNHGGFHYCLVKSFANHHGLRLEVEWRPFTFKYYFAKNGEYDDKVAHDLTTTYTPDVLKRVDIAVDGFSKLPWREKFGRFVPISISRQMIIYNTKRMSKPTAIKDLKGKTVYVRPGTIQEDLAKDIAAKVPIVIKHYLTKSQEVKPTDEMAPLAKGQADFMIYPSTYSLVDSKGIDNLGFGLAIGKVDGAFWMLARRNESLENAIKAYLDIAKADGTFTKCFKDNYGLGYQEYLRNLSILSETKGSQSPPVR